MAPGGDGGDSVGGRERSGGIFLEMASLVKESEEGFEGSALAIEGYGGEVAGLFQGEEGGLEMGRFNVVEFQGEEVGFELGDVTFLASDGGEGKVLQCEVAREFREMVEHGTARYSTSFPGIVFADAVGDFPGHVAVEDGRALVAADE